MEKFKAFIERLDVATEVATRSDDTSYTKFKESETELHDWFFEAVVSKLEGNFSELDAVYNALSTLPEIVSNSESFDDLGDNINEYEWADIYNADLLEWVKSDLYRIADVDEQLGAGVDNLVGAIQWAQHAYRTDLARDIVDAVREKVGE